MDAMETLIGLFPHRGGFKSSGHSDLILKLSQLTFTCSKSTTETLEKGVKIVQKLTVKTPEQHH